MGQTIVSQSQRTTFGERPHLLPMAPLQQHKAINVVFALSSILGFLESFLSMRRLMLSIRGRDVTGILYLPVNKTISVLFKLMARALKFKVLHKEIRNMSLIARHLSLVTNKEQLVTYNMLLSFITNHKLLTIFFKFSNFNEHLTHLQRPSSIRHFTPVKKIIVKATKIRYKRVCCHLFNALVYIK